MGQASGGIHPASAIFGHRYLDCCRIDRQYTLEVQRTSILKNSAYKSDEVGRRGLTSTDRGDTEESCAPGQTFPESQVVSHG